MVSSLQGELAQLEKESADLKGIFNHLRIFRNLFVAKIEAVQRKEEAEREALKKKQAEEVQFLKVIF